MVGGTIVLGTLAGCSGGDEEEPESTPTTAEESGDAATPEEPAEGGVSFAVDPSTDEIDWGETYTVTVAVSAGEDPPFLETGIVYETESDSSWSGGFDNTVQMWQLEGGESQSETYEIEPSAVGDLKLGLMRSAKQEVVEEWDLTVNPPTAAFGEPISYYDGLDVTLDVELHEWLEFELEWGYPEVKKGMYSVHPTDGQWVTVSITAENTNTNSEVRLPEREDFSGLGGNSQLEPYAGRKPVGGDTDYELDQVEEEWDMSSGEERPYLMMEYDDYTQEGYWKPPRTLISGAVEDGWLLFETGADVTVDDIEIRLNRNDIRATWG
jgi:hypothetical protein